MNDAPAAAPAAPLTTTHVLPADTPIFVRPTDRDTLRRLGLPSSSVVYEMLADGRLNGRRVGSASYVAVADIVAAVLASEPLTVAKRRKPAN